MSNEEAILVLQNDAYILYEDDMPYDRQAYDIAVKALETKPFGVLATEPPNRDKITLKDALETPVWMMVYAAEPMREIDVTMTYADLKAIYDWVHLVPEVSITPPKTDETCSHEWDVTCDPEWRDCHLLKG